MAILLQQYLAFPCSKAADGVWVEERYYSVACVQYFGIHRT